MRDLQLLIAGNRSSPVSSDTEIGCTVLTDVFFLPRKDWIPVDGRFASNIMVGRTYHTDADHDAQLLWNQVHTASTVASVAETMIEEAPRYGREFLSRARLGQGSFRTLVIDAYRRRCAMTGESTLPALEAAHIQSCADLGPHQVSNGLLVRSDFHKLFDAGLVTVDPNYRIQISGRIRDQYFNGRAYYRLHGQESAALPEDSQDHPNPEFLRWHNENRFVA